MRKYLVLFAVCIYSIISNGQNVGIGIPNPQNKLHVGGGFRLDTLTGVGGSGLLWHNPNGVVYGTKFTGNTNDVLRGDGTFGSGGAGSVGWLLNGNSGTNPATNFLGTSDNQPLLFRVNNVRHGYLGNSIFLGSEAGIANNVSGNIGIGERSLYSNVTPNANTALGIYTLEKNTSGTSNIAIGNFALKDNIDGSYNVGIGYLSLGANTAGFSNTSVGNYSLRNNISGSSNSAFGYSALLNNTTGSQNVAVGLSALNKNSTGSNNTAVGYEALALNTSGHNSALGYQALRGNIDGESNTAIGFSSLLKNISGDGNTATGAGALENNTTGYHNTAVGLSVLKFNNGYYNSALGTGAMVFNTSGHDNTAIGTFALNNNTTASFNTSVGAFSLYQNNDGQNNTAIGYKSLEQNDGSNNTSVGFGALQGSHGMGNTAIGLNALVSNNSGSGNIGVGYFADVTQPNLFNATAIGFDAKVGASNSLVLGGIGIGAVKVGIGVQVPVSTLHVRGSAKFFANGVNHTGNFWNGTSNMSGVEITSSGNDAYIGIQRAGQAGLHISHPFGSTGDFVAFFNSSVLVGRITSDGVSTAYNTSSDFRLKENRRSSQYSLNTLMKIKAEDYNYISDNNKNTQTGFIAQDLYKIYPQAVTPGGNDPKTNPWMIDYGKLTPLLVKAVQEQQTIIEKQQKQIDDLIKRIEALEKK